ncbi:MAG: hypothetical protein IPK13_18705 [Deltaproteobacteria bacterium]|nr:hypothetical protein [Deltaproteobacteria bacterium]
MGCVQTEEPNEKTSGWGEATGRKGLKMLDAYIIEQIKKEQRENGDRDQDRPRLHIHLPLMWRPALPEPAEDHENEEGHMVVIPLTPEMPLYDLGDFEGENAA